MFLLSLQNSCLPYVLLPCRLYVHSYFLLSTVRVFTLSTVNVFFLSAISFFTWNVHLVSVFTLSAVRVLILSPVSVECVHYAPDPALEVEVEADNTWRELDVAANAPVDPGPRSVLKKRPPQEEVLPKPRSATKIRLKNTPERWSPQREQLPEIPEGDGFAGHFTTAMRQVVNEAYVMPLGIRIGNYKGCNLLSDNIQTLIPPRWLDDNVIDTYMNLIERLHYPVECKLSLPCLLYSKCLYLVCFQCLYLVYCKCLYLVCFKCLYTYIVYWKCCIVLYCTVLYCMCIYLIHCPVSVSVPWLQEVLS